MSNKRTIINIDKGPVHIFWSLRENEDEPTPPKTLETATEPEKFESPETGWMYLATEDDDP